MDQIDTVQTVTNLIKNAIESLGWIVIINTAHHGHPGSVVLTLAGRGVEVVITPQGEAA